jgi:hypothetical protein
MNYNELGDLKREINKGYSIKFKEAIGAEKGIEFKNMSERMKFREEFLREYKEKIYEPARKVLKEECGKLGHRISWDTYHINIVGNSSVGCAYCGILLRMWLENKEIKLENGEVVIADDKIVFLEDKHE